MSVLDFFPHTTFRPFQKETILDIQQSLDSDEIENVVLESPTGSGKSAIAICLGLYYKSAFLLTSQKILQDQYAKDYSSGRVCVLKGRNNYPCKLLPDFTCEDSYCSTKQCPVKPECFYEIAKQQAVESFVALMNYKYFLCITNYTGTFSDRKLLICDEAHNLDNECMSFVEFSFSSFNLSKLGVTSKIPLYEKLEEYVEWLKMLQEKIKERRKETTEKLKNKFLDVAIISDLQKELESLISQQERVKMFLESYGKIEWIFDITTNEKLRSKTIIFKPLTVGFFAQNLLFKHAEKKLFMSATILDKDSFCKNLDLDSKKTKFIQVASSFPVDIRPIILTRSGNLGKNDIEESLPKIAFDVGRILEFHDSEKGLIHCVDENSKITTKNGSVLIRDIKVGEEVKTYNEKTKKFEFKKVLNNFDQGEQECLKLSFFSTEIVCTFDHPFLTKNRGWVKAKDLNLDDDIVSYYEKRIKKEKCAICNVEFITTLRTSKIRTCSPKCQGVYRHKYRMNVIKLDEYVFDKEKFILYDLNFKKLDIKKKFEYFCEKCKKIFITSIAQQKHRNFKLICRSCATKEGWKNETCKKSHKESDAKSWTQERREISRNNFKKLWSQQSFRKRIVELLHSEEVQRKSVYLSIVARRHIRIDAFDEIFKSTYEYRFAKALNENNIKWSYEPERFSVLVDNKIKYYYPDFYLQKYNLWIEIKGFWFEHQKEKFENFKKQYPEITIKVFYEEQIKQIERKNLYEITS